MANMSILNALIECSIDCPSLCNWPISFQCPQCLPQYMLYGIGFDITKWNIEGLLSRSMYFLCQINALNPFWILWIPLTPNGVAMFITRDSEVIMFSPGVFVCLFVCLFVCVCGRACVCLSVCLSACLYICHDVCPDDLTMKHWCRT